MELQERIALLVRLGEHLKAGEDEYLKAVMQRTYYRNQWFTIENQEKAIQAIAIHFLDESKIRDWITRYDMPENQNVKTIGLVMAGNIPLVGFHDLLCVFIAGHRAEIKISDKDPFLLPYLLKLLARFDPRAEGFFEIVERLKEFDGVIATGSNNSARYFNAYFGKYPHIIRRNRSAVAVLTGEESKEELSALGKDIFQYFGLGCRNVSKVYVPENYDFEPLLESLHLFRDIITHAKYRHNFDFNFATHVLNKVKYKNNGCIILTENKSMQSRIAELHYEFYDHPEELEKELASRDQEIQCILARSEVLHRPTLPFGQAQQPELRDYADGVDTLAFLLNL